MTINVPQSVYDDLAEIRERMGKFQKNEKCHDRIGYDEASHACNQEG